MSEETVTETESAEESGEEQSARESWDFRIFLQGAFTGGWNTRYYEIPPPFDQGFKWVVVDGRRYQAAIADMDNALNQNRAVFIKVRNRKPGRYHEVDRELGVEAYSAKIDYGTP